MIVLLVLSLMLSAGCEAEREIEACEDGWFEFTCTYSKQGPNAPSLSFHSPSHKNLKSTKLDKWEKKQDFFLYHNTSAKLLRVVAKNPKSYGDYKCVVGGKEGPELEVKKKESCTQLHPTVYEMAKTTVTCNSDSKDGEHFFCKDDGLDCMEIVSKRSLVSSDGRFTLTKMKSGFNVSISNVSSWDHGVYWCGVKPADGFYRRSHTQIQLDVQNISTDTLSATVGETLTCSCRFTQESPIKKFLCKEEDPSRCEPLVSSAKPHKGRFSLKVDRLKQAISITVTDLRINDSGKYLCGAVNRVNAYVFSHRLVLTVEPRPATHQGDSLLLVISAIVAATCAAVLVLSVVIYRRCRNSTHKEAENEDHHYAEIEERPQKPDSGTAPKTVYVTASFPTTVSASHHSNALFENRGSPVGGSVQGPAYSTVNHPSSVTVKPLYSKVNFPVDQQQH